MAAASTIFPQELLANSFTGEQFAQWTDAQQRSYLNAQIVMASSIVTRAKPGMAQCMADKYYGANGLSEDGFQEISKVIREYNNYHPSSVLVVVLENACGKFY